MIVTGILLGHDSAILCIPEIPNPEKCASVQFKGLSVPGQLSVSASEALVAVWKTSGGQRFQNYRSVFTILDLAVIERTAKPLEKAPENIRLSGEFRGSKDELLKVAQEFS